jgi:transcriptional regulator with XRE-family HTH domain
MPSSSRSLRRRRLAELLVAYREQAGLKQSELAERLGRHQPFVSNLEAGQRRLDLVELLDIAAALDFDPRDLIGELLQVPPGPA